VTGVIGVTGLPVPADFAPPPDTATRARWRDADHAHRPVRLAGLREHLATLGLDGYFGVRREHMRWLTGFVLAEGEEKVAGHSGQLLVGRDEVVVLTDSRYTVQAVREAPAAVVEEIGYDLPAAWTGLQARLGIRRLGIDAGSISHGLWERLAAAAPDVELVAMDGWIDAHRAIKTSDEIERIAAACAVADRALAALLPQVLPGRTEYDLAMALEWGIRTDGAEALAFDIACLAGAEAALPHGSPGDRPVTAGTVLLFDFGAQVEGYRSDMTRTLFIGEPAARDLDIYRLVAASQQAAIDAITGAMVAGAAVPDGRALDATARGVIDTDGRWRAYQHGLGHGIGLATHEEPRLSRSAPDTPLPSPTVFSVEPGIYLEGETGVRIEDLVHLDAARAVLERLTLFPRDVIALPA
jgi:Xaa-Pro aminopeptidase